MAKKAKADRLVITLECTDVPRAELHDREESAQRSGSAGAAEVLPALSDSSAAPGNAVGGIMRSAIVRHA